jgi:hypothetical protein
MIYGSDLGFICYIFTSFGRDLDAFARLGGFENYNFVQGLAMNMWTRQLDTEFKPS